MRTLFDTSALFPALDESHQFHSRALPCLEMAQRKEIHGIVAAHTLAELYGGMSGRIRPMPPTVDIFDRISEDIVPYFELVPLETADYLTALERLARLNIRGGSIYDGIIAHAAVKANAEQIITFNESDFLRVSAGLPLQIVVP